MKISREPSHVTRMSCFHWSLCSITTGKQNWENHILLHFFIQRTLYVDIHFNLCVDIWLICWGNVLLNMFSSLSSLMCPWLSHAYTTYPCCFLVWCSALIGRTGTDEHTVKIMWQSGIFGIGVGSLISSWGRTVKLPWVCTITSQYPSWYHPTWCKCVNLQQPIDMSCKYNLPWHRAAWRNGGIDKTRLCQRSCGQNSTESNHWQNW